MYYLWICLWFYDGNLVYPVSQADITPFLARMWGHIVKDASPNLYAWKVYSGNVAFQLFLAQVLPGYRQEGLPVPSLNYKTLIYNCNALNSLYVTLITAAGLHWSGIFRLTEIIDNYGHLMSVAMIYGFSVALGTYLYAVFTNTQIRTSGNPFYDYFMGACLNPRIGNIDLKMWGEVRIPWVIVFFLAVSGGCKQYEQYGYVTPSYVYSVVYMASHDFSTYRFSTLTYIIMYATLLTAYYIWDTAMSQKSRFKMQSQGITEFRNTFPQLPGCIVKDPTYIQTAHGCNYVADWTMSLMWGAIVGTASIIPYFYSVFFIAVLIHRCSRDFERCSRKYGKDWDRYCEVVRWKFIPYFY
ncbi:hypothetical protein C0989_006655 [Termitomyces sp. Mn162]|nr:hypothetical protein C0989_006655 [Termitomyces sp. Mn162]